MAIQNSRGICWHVSYIFEIDFKISNQQNSSCFEKVVLINCNRAATTNIRVNIIWPIVWVIVSSQYLLLNSYCIKRGKTDWLHLSNSLRYLPMWGWLHLSNAPSFAREQVIKQEGNLIVPETVWGKVNTQQIGQTEWLKLSEPKFE